MDDGSSLQTLLVGVDAACDRVLAPMFDDDELPTIESIYEQGVSTPLESQIPPWTASAWPSLYTGKNPGKHGVFGFLSFDGYDWDVVNASDVRERAIWELLDEHDMTSVVVNVPVTHPAREFDGALIPATPPRKTPSASRPASSRRFARKSASIGSIPTRTLTTSVRPTVNARVCAGSVSLSRRSVRPRVRLRRVSGNGLDLPQRA